MKDTLILTITILFLPFIFPMKFTFDIQQRNKQCFKEHFTQFVPVTFSVQTSEKAKIRIRLINPKGLTLLNKEQTGLLKISYNPNDHGIHQFCIDNINKENLTYKFEYIYGVAAKDYTSLVKSEKIKPVELHLLKLYETMEIIHREFNSIITKEKTYYIEQNNNISSNIVYFTVIVLCLIVFINTIEFFYLRTAIYKRKIK